MKIRQLAVLAATCIAASAFAQSSVTSSTGASVSSGTGIVVTPALPATSVTVLPSTVAIPDAPLLPGGTMVQYSTTTVMGAPGAPAGSTTKVTRYWTNVPANVASWDSFQRWQRLR